ncbi:MAG: AAA family ATPase [Cyanobacteria bacterium J06598_3]
MVVHTMLDEQSLDIITYNKNALNNLRRAVVLGQGQFSLILARANYRQLQHVLIRELEAHLRLHPVALAPTTTGLREALIMGTITLRPVDQVQALMVTGIESVHQLESLLKSANLGRDELPKAFRYTIVLWVTDAVLQQLNRYAPDLKSFAASPLRFEYPVRSLITTLSDQANDTFTQILDSDQGIVLSNRIPLTPGLTEPLADRELAAALAQLETQEQFVDNDLLADLLFLQGRNLHQQGDLARARSYYEKSLAHWQQQVPSPQRVQDPVPAPPTHPISPVDKQAVLLFHLGLWWRSHGIWSAASAGDTYTADCRKARQYFEQCLAIFREQDRTDRVARFILALAEVLQKLENWTDLSAIAQEGTTLHQGDPARLARDYGYLAEIALAHYKNDPHPDYLSEAERYAQQALAISAECLTNIAGDRIVSKAPEKNTNAPAEPTRSEPNLSGFEPKRSDSEPERSDNVIQLPVLKAASESSEFATIDSEASQTPQPASLQPVSLQPASLQPASLQPVSPQQTEALEEQQIASQLALRYHQSCYYYLLAVAQQLQNQPKSAIAQLEKARSHSNPHYDISLHRRILNRLWHLHYAHQHYAKAFAIKLAQRRIETHFGLRAFIGAAQIQPSAEERNAYAAYHRTGKAAPSLDASTTLAMEIQASGRTQDIETLANRLTQPRYPLIVIHGQSGVGKSSLLSAGLRPKLHTLTSEGRSTLPVFINSYARWTDELQRALDPQDGPLDGPQDGQQNGQQERQPESPNAISSVTACITRLKVLTQQQYQQVVLIFDQFEDFFFDHSVPSQRRELYAFLRDCLELPYVKVVLSLREDFLHYLLEWDRNADLSIINNDVLSKEIRYYLGNFRPKAAELLITQLTKTAGFVLEEGLITALVDDLAEATGEVRPIELQVVGAQLQRENITTLSQYQALGRSPKSQLLSNFLESVIKDCGPENATMAKSVLFLLGEGTGRTIKSRSEIEEAIVFASVEASVEASVGASVEAASRGDHDRHAESGISANPQRNRIDDLTTNLEQLQLVLEILVGSGLIFEVPEVSGVRYQLVHEYLASLVQQQPPTGLIEALQNERSRRQLTEEQLQKALEAESDSIRQTTLARQNAQRAEIRALVSIAQSLRLSGNGLEALEKSMRAARKVIDQGLSHSEGSGSLSMQTALCLDATVREIREKNTLNDHRNWVLAVHCQLADVRLNNAADETVAETFLQGSQDTASDSAPNSAPNTAPNSAIRAMIASASDDGTIKLWSDRGQLLRTLTGHHAGVLDVKFSLDGRYLASASLDHTIRLWHANGDFIRAIDTVAASVTSISFSPTEPLLAATYSDSLVRLWSVAGEQVLTLNGHEDWTRSVAFSPDGQRLVSGSEDQTIRLWSRQGELLHIMHGSQGWVRSLAFSPDGQTIVSAGDSNTLRLWYADGRKKKTLYGHDDWIRTVAFSPDGQRIASGSDDQTIKIWGSEGTIQQTFNQRGSVHSLAWSADGTSVVSGGDDDQVHIWQLSGPPEPICKGHAGIVWSAQWRPQQRHPQQNLLSAGGDNTIKLWTSEGELMTSIIGHQRGVHSVDWSPEGEFFVSASADHTVRIWTAEGHAVRSLQGHEDAVWQVCYSPDGGQIASVSSDRTLRLWTPKGKLLKTHIGHTDTVWHVSYSPDGQHLITASEDNTLRLWHHKKGLIQTISGEETGYESTHDGGIWCACFSPNGQFMASGGADGVIRLWSVSWQAHHHLRIEPSPLRLRGHRDWVRSLCFSADSQLLASGSDDTTVRLWSLQPESLAALKATTEPHSRGDRSAVGLAASATANFESLSVVDQNHSPNHTSHHTSGPTSNSLTPSHLLPPLTGHNGVVWDVDFHPQDNRLVSTSADGTLRIWDLRLEALLNKGCHWLEDWLATRPDVKQQLCTRPSSKSSADTSTNSRSL